MKPGRFYRYWLEDVDLSGATTLHGPVSAQAAPAGRSRRLWLPLVN